MNRKHPDWHGLALSERIPRLNFTAVIMTEIERNIGHDFLWSPKNVI